MKEYYRNQIADIYDGEPWLGATFIEVLKGVTVEQAFQRPKEHSKSMIEILYHIVAWRKHIFKRLSLDFDTKLEINSSEDWMRFENIDAIAWKQLLDALKENQQQILDLLDTKNDGFLNTWNPNNQYQLHSLLNGLIHHDLYHLGQIAIIKSQLNSTI